MISQLFVLSSRGDVLVNRDFRAELPRNSTETFYRQVCRGATEQPPVFVAEGVTFFFLRRAGLFLVCTARKPPPAALALELLEQLATLVKNFCGVLSEEAVRLNAILIYELLDELLDYGYPRALPADAVREGVLSRPVTPAGLSLPRRLPLLKPATLRVQAALRPITGGGTRNELFVDVIEQLTAVLGTSGTSRSTIDGLIKVKSYLVGTPRLRVLLSADAPLDGVSFDSCVDDAEFESARRLLIVPPPGECTAMLYRTAQQGVLPFKVVPLLTMPGPLRAELVVRLSFELESAASAKLVEARFSLPAEARSCALSVEEGARGQKAVYREQERLVEWGLESMRGGSEAFLTARMALAEESTPARLKATLGAVKLRFEVNHAESCAVRIRSLTVEGSEGAPAKWVRYLTTSESYVTRF